MSAPVHTPGPWAVFPYYYQDGNGGDQRLIGQGQFDTIAEVRMGHDDLKGDVDANARLIAAAPDLLAALRSLAFNAKAMRAFEYEIRDVAGHTNWQCLVDAVGQAEAAITRATTGEAQ